MSHLLDTRMDVLGMQAVIFETEVSGSNEARDLPQEEHSVVRADLIVDNDIANLESNIADEWKDRIPPLH